MAGNPSFYFTLFKKFQVLNHVPSNTVHGNAGAPQSGFNLTDSNAIFAGSNRGNPINMGSGTPSDSPLWAVLNSRASGTAGFTPVNVAGVDWPTMPPGSPAAWVEFQVNQSPPKLVDTFSTWIQNNRVNDTPNGVLGTKPPAFQGPEPGVNLFVCSMPGDQGVRPGVPSNFWATSLIFLADANGNTQNPSTLTSSQEWFLTAVIGNRGNTNAGRYINHPPAVEAAASVMVWNTVDSPGVQLPSLSNLDVNDKNGIYEQYFLRSGEYDVVGFRMNVQTVYNGIIAALNDAVTNNGLNLAGLTPDQWVHAQPAHLCAKVVVREQGTSFPNFGLTPDQDARLAQKNLAPFDINLTATDPSPNINWKNFIVGQPIFLRLRGAGKNKLTLVRKLQQDLFELYLAIPRETFERVFRKGGGIKGFKEMSRDELCKWPLWERAKPFPHAVVLRAVADNPTLEIPAMDEGQYLGMSLGIEYNVKKLKPGALGEVTLVHETVLPKAVPGSLCFELGEAIVGGFTLVLRAFDPHLAPDGKRYDFPDAA